VTNKFPYVSDAKIKEVISVGPKIRELIQDIQIHEDLNETERNEWMSFNYQDVGRTCCLLTKLWDAI